MTLLVFRLALATASFGRVLPGFVPTSSVSAATSSGAWRPCLAAAVLCLLLGASPEPGHAQRTDWPFDDSDDSDLVYVHALLNYAVHPDWVRDWERGLASTSSARVTVGSVTNRRFLTDVRVRLNEALGTSPLRFIYDLRWLDGEHVDTARLQQFMGFEVTVAGPLSVQALVHPTSRKEDLDLRVGLVLTDDAREQYLVASLRLDDFLYGDKNRQGGQSEQEPVGLAWEGRAAGRSWEVFSEGWYGSESRRVFPEPALSPLLAAAVGAVNGSETRVRWLSGETAYLEVGLSHYRFREAQEWRETNGSYDYTNRILEGVVRYAFSPHRRWRAWPALHVLTRDATATGRRDYRLDRTDLMPALFVSYALDPANALELGYMGSASERTRTDTDPALSFDHQGWADKVKLAWTHAFGARIHLQLSISQEVSSGRFGGGNVQFVGVF